MNSRSKGFTLVELLVVITIGTIVMTAVVQVMATQERVNRQQMAIVGTEQNARMALGVIEADLREVSATDGDIYYADSVSIRFRALRKAGIICTKDYGTNTYVKAAVWGQPFAAEDSVLVFMEGANKSAASDDSWGVTRVTAVSASTCAGNPIGNVQQITIPAATVTNTDSGGLVRSFTPVGFRIVTAASNGVLYRMEGADSVAVVEGLGTAGASAGLRLRYFNAAGTQITPSTAALRATIMRIQIKVAARQAGGQTGANRLYADSLIGMVFLRGNRKTT